MLIQQQSDSSAQRCWGGHGRRARREADPQLCCTHLSGRRGTVLLVCPSFRSLTCSQQKIQKKREAMYTLIEKADIYATQIDIAVAGRVLDASLQRRLQRLYSYVSQAFVQHLTTPHATSRRINSVFLKIEALVDVKAGVNNNALTRVLQNVIIKPNRAESLVVELEREIQLFQARSHPVVSCSPAQLCTAPHGNTAEPDSRRDSACRGSRHEIRRPGTRLAVCHPHAKHLSKFRVLRDCDIDKRDIIERRETEQGTVVWASARVDGQLMVLRYLDPSPLPQRGNNIVSEVAAWRRAPYHEYLANVAKVS